LLLLLLLLADVSILGSLFSLYIYIRYYSLIRHRLLIEVS